MDKIYPIRCRVAHSTCIFTSSDIDDIFNFTREIYSSIVNRDEEFLEFLDKIEKEPEYFSIIAPNNLKCELTLGIPNNLPMPDFEYEGGFVGRVDDIKKLKKYIEGDLHRVITVTGAGGVGKTAIIQQILNEILTSNKNIFDGIIWTSAKENKLSAVGIEDIEPTIKNYEELLDTIINTMGYGLDNLTVEQKAIDVNEIFEIHKKILIIIDNLETITDNDIIDFILDAHKNIKIIITSRRGLGQVERRYELNQLKESEAVALFRQISREKNLFSLSRLDDKTIKGYVNKIACYPLAIKWIIGNVAIGKDINLIIDSAINKQSDIAKFCFEQIYNSLKENSKILLCILSMFDAPVQAGILIYVLNQNQSDFEDCLKDLVLVSLVIQSQEKGSDGNIITKYNLLSLTRGFVREQLDNNRQLKLEIQERIRLVEDTVEQAEKAKKIYKHSLSDFGASTDAEKVAALLGNTAFQKYQMGRYSEAVEHYQRAVNIAPGLPSIYRNWAVMESSEGHPVEADKLMEKAANLNPDDAQIWHIWGNMRRKDSRINEALTYYEKAIALFPDDQVILNALGQAKTRLGEFKEAEDLYLKALSVSENLSEFESLKNKIINNTSLSDNYRRWAEHNSNENNIFMEKENLEKALSCCEKALELDREDNKTNDLYRKTLFQIAHFTKKTKSDVESIEQFSYFLNTNPKRWNEIKYLALSSKELIKIYAKNRLIEEAKKTFNNNIFKYIKRYGVQHYNDFMDIYNTLDRKNAVSGVIVKVNPEKGFTIIETNEENKKTYLGHVKNFHPQTSEIDESIKGTSVTFIPFFNERHNREEAKFIYLES